MFNAKSFDLKIVLGCLLLLNLLSLTAIYSSLHQGGELVDKGILYRQVIWIAIAWIFLIAFSLINYRIYYDLTYLFYGINILLLLAVYFFGKKAMGAQRWLSILGFVFQPSELSKITTIIICARFFCQGHKSGILKDFLLPLGLVGLNALIIFKQPDLGTALVILIIFVSLGLLARFRRRYFAGLIILILAASPFALRTLKDYQKKRLMVFINPDADPLGSGYTIIQSKIAIGSGKAFGKGFLAGTQNQFNFLPERHTDFIFTVIAEEWGLAGCLFLLLIYWLILNKILARTKELRDRFAYFLCSGISILFFIHIFVNIGMTLGILPVVGLPLIFLSYGGTNLLISSILIGIFLNVCRNQK